MVMETTPAEFQRQLRGLFAVLRTLVRQTTQGRETVEDYAARLEGRIGALARVHEMLMRAPSTLSSTALSRAPADGSRLPGSLLTRTERIGCRFVGASIGRATKLWPA